MLLNLKIPPVVVGVSIASLQWIVASSFPILDVEMPMRMLYATLFAALGVCIAVVGVVAFRMASTTVNPHSPQNTSALVCTGLYARTRNPMYLGMALVLTGWAVYLSHWGAFVGIPVFISYMTTFQIKPEEAQLRTLFPDEFDTYCKKTRRWV